MEKNKKSEDFMYCPDFKLIKFLTKIKGKDIAHPNQYNFVGIISKIPTYNWLNASSIISNRQNNIKIIDSNFNLRGKVIVKIQPFKENFQDIKDEFSAYKLLNNSYDYFPKVYCHFICNHDILKFDERTKEGKILGSFCKKYNKDDNNFVHIGIIELVKGIPLCNIKGDKMDLNKMNNIFKKVLEALIIIAKNHRIINNDLINGENIFITSNNNIKIIDFGRSDIIDKNKNLFIKLKFSIDGFIRFLISRFGYKFNLSEVRNNIDNTKNINELQNIKNKGIQKSKFEYQPFILNDIDN